jgi:4-hydroxyphenylpyruvate dioxygenase
MTEPWPSTKISNLFGIATLSLGSHQHHTLADRLCASSKAGFTHIDLFDEDWAAYLASHQLDPSLPWEPTAANLRAAQQLGDLVKALGMQIACTQPLRKIEGIRDPAERRATLDLVAKRFPFMRAFDTDLVFMCSNIRTDSGVTSDLQTVARDLAELGDMAAAFSRRDGGRMLNIGYEGLSWAVRNTWSSSWEVVRAANRPNVGLVVDSFNLLAVEFADPYHPAGHGRIYSTVDESMAVLYSSLAALVATVPGDRIFFVQLGDAELVDPETFLPPEDPEVPRLLPWSREHRLFPVESERGGYMPVELVAAAVLATGYKGPFSLEVFNKSLIAPDPSVPSHHAERGYVGLQNLVQAVSQVPRFWDRAVLFSGVSWGRQELQSSEKQRPLSRTRIAPFGSNL